MENRIRKEIENIIGISFKLKLCRAQEPAPLRGEEQAGEGICGKDNEAFAQGGGYGIMNYHR